MSVKTRGIISPVRDIKDHNCYHSTCPPSLSTSLCDPPPHTNMMTFKAFHEPHLPSGLTVGLQTHTQALARFVCKHTHSHTNTKDWHCVLLEPVASRQSHMRGLSPSHLTMVVAVLTSLKPYRHNFT